MWGQRYLCAQKTGSRSLLKSLADGFFADAVILALAKASSRGHVDPADQPLFNEVEAFLDRVLGGYRWFDNPTVNEESANNASFFGQAVRAVVSVHTRNLLNNSGNVRNPPRRPRG